MDELADAPLNIDEMSSDERFYKSGEEFILKTLERAKKIKFDTGRRIIEGLWEEYRENAVRFVANLDVDIDKAMDDAINEIIEKSVEEKITVIKNKLNILYRPLVNIQAFGRFIFRDIIDLTCKEIIESKLGVEEEGKIEIDWEEEYKKAKNENTILQEQLSKKDDAENFDVDWKYEYGNLEKEIERLNDIIKKYHSFIRYDCMDDIKPSTEEEAVQRYCVNQEDQRICLLTLGGIREGNTNCDQYATYLSTTYGLNVDYNHNPLIKAVKKAIRRNDCPSLAILLNGCSLTSCIVIKDKKNNEYFSLFGYACKEDSIESALFLLKKGVGIRNAFDQGETPLIQAVKANNVIISEFLVGKGAGIEARDGEGNSPLHWAARCNSDEASKFLIDRRANIEARNFDGETPLHKAASFNSIDVEKRLIDSGADINSCDRNHKTPVHVAVLNRNAESLRLLIDKGANLDACDKNGRSPLHLAVIENELGICQTLINGKANVNIKDMNNRTPLDIMGSSYFPKIARLLIENGAELGINLLHKAAIHDDTDVLDILIDRGYDINEQDSNGCTPLFIATSSGKANASKLLIEKGARLDLKNCIGISPLYEAVTKNHFEIVKQLIDGGADIYEIFDERKTFLHIVKDNMVESARVLIENNANIDAIDCNGWTPLHEAAYYDASLIVQLLVESGANIFARNDNNQTPLDVSAEFSVSNAILISLSYD